ncbi:MAG TPA: peptide chain release factor 2 [Acidimicrobiales bacterium]|nr:peptide chain release factor 2 [Acidimicrobiales bacterium]
MRDYRDDFGALGKRLDEARGYLREDDARARVTELELEMGRADLWDDPDVGRALSSEFAALSGDIEQIAKLEQAIADARTLWELGVEEGDESVGAEIDAALESAAREFDALELRSLFTGEHDELDAVCEIHAGEGGTDAQDWAEMMLRMYLRWAERRGFKVELDEVTEGQEAGILSASFVVRGRYAYGLLEGERGSHRLYRISPFDSQARRQTSYAALDVVPFIEDVSNEVTIDEKDLRTDVYRSSGAGGQHVNVTDSAVRLTHLPTGIVVSCQNERSQLQNKAKAMQVLMNKLAERNREERRAEMAALSGPQGAVGRAGAFIRGYVLAPYQKVKDERTAHESGNVESVLDGDLDEFMEAYLRYRRTGA